MSFIGITGDTHGSPLDMRKFSVKQFKKGKELTRDDFIIICGDFGFLWEQQESEEEKYWLDWLNDKPWTTLWLDGNHENFDRIYTLPTEQRYGSDVGVVRNNVLHLRRGNIYTLGGHSFFCMGGGLSIDKHYRLKFEEGYRRGVLKAKPKPRSCWWPEEYPSPEEWANAYKNLHAVDYRVDYVISHVPPYRVLDYYFGYSHHNKLDYDTVGINLQDMCDLLRFKMWYHGHMHLDIQRHPKFQAVYHEIVEVGEGYDYQDLWRTRFDS